METNQGRWFELSSNPEDPNVIASRRKKIQSLYCGTQETLSLFLDNAIKGADLVFDVGFANHDQTTASISDSWTHALVISKARQGARVIGVDPVEVANCESDQHFQDLRAATKSVRALQYPRARTVALNVLEHVDNASGFLDELKETLRFADCSHLLISTPNPGWTPHLFSWANIDNLGVNVDHVALYGPSELVEAAERLGYFVLRWGYFGKLDMPKAFRPGPGPQRIFWHFFYYFSRKLDLPFAHNQIWIELTLGRCSSH